MYKKFLLILIVSLLSWLVTNVLSQNNQGSDVTSETQIEAEHDHSNCDGHHDEVTDSKDQDEETDHADHDHDEEADHADHEGHSDELSIKLTHDAIKLAGIKFSTVEHGRIGKMIELPGEVGFNEDRLAHIAPRFAGIALKTNYRVGDFVEKDDVVAVIESNESMNPYSIKAPFSGWVIKKHITQGEFVSEENSIFVIADLSTVWVNLAVYPKDANRIKIGQTAIIETIGTNSITTGKIEYVTPIIDFRTRSATARIVLSNSNNTMRPGSFVQATITTEAGDEVIVVEKNSVQFLEGESVIFVADGKNNFTPVEVIIGDSDDKFTQVVSGISEGARYVSTGAFELKAKIVTSNLDAHAGHGH